MPSDPNCKPSLTSGFGRAMGLAAELVATTVVGAGLGWLLGRWLGSPAVFVLLGTLVGGAAGVTGVYRTWKRQT